MKLTYTRSTAWSNRAAVYTGLDSRYTLQCADLQDSRGNTFPDGTWRVIDHVDRTKTDQPRVLRTFKGETAWNSAYRLAEDLNLSSRMGTGTTR